LPKTVWYQPEAKALSFQYYIIFIENVNLDFSSKSSSFFWERVRRRNKKDCQRTWQP